MMMRIKMINIINLNMLCKPAKVNLGLLGGGGDDNVGSLMVTVLVILKCTAVAARFSPFEQPDQPFMWTFGLTPFPHSLHRIDSNPEHHHQENSYY